MQGCVSQHVSSYQSGLMTVAELQRLTVWWVNCLVINCYQTCLDTENDCERVGSSPGKSPSKKLAFSLGQQPVYKLHTLALTSEVFISSFLSVFLNCVFSGHRNVAHSFLHKLWRGDVFVRLKSGSGEPVWLSWMFCSFLSWWKYIYSSDRQKWRETLEPSWEV